jgi:hypothetical protein
LSTFVRRWGVLIHQQKQMSEQAIEPITTTEAQVKPRKQRKSLGRRNAKRTTNKLRPETKAIRDQGPAAWAKYMRDCKLKLPPAKRGRLGIPDGMRRAEAEPLWEASRVKAAWIMSELERHGII